MIVGLCYFAMMFLYFAGKFLSALAVADGEDVAEGTVAEGVEDFVLLL